MQSLIINSILALFLTFPAKAEDVFKDCPNCPQMVALKNFAISKFEISFNEWQACTECRQDIDDHGWGKDTQPMINISFNDALAYANWLSRITGQKYRIPSEEEWEEAARAGTSTPFWWGEDKGRNMANCRDCETPWSGKSPAPQGSFLPNPWGIHDMNGNVWEWTESCWQGEYAKGAAVPPNFNQDCPLRVIRGGSWYYYSPMSQASARAPNHPAVYSYNIGVRIIRLPAIHATPKSPK